MILMEPGGDLAAQAVELLRENGPVHAGGPAGDFGTIGLDAPSAFLDGPNVIGTAAKLTVVHVEDKRPR
ncbi:hypothetical protein [Actinomadura soli]|uniref:hypothetical protein n=1 Tax=Actinomadura soli TaxID=2508997 RepID=UPI00197AD1EE|nr:hypothetical protein [Actinomadura soli]